MRKVGAAVPSAAAGALLSSLSFHLSEQGGLKTEPGPLDGVMALGVDHSSHDRYQCESSSGLARCRICIL